MLKSLNIFILLVVLLLPAAVYAERIASIVAVVNDEPITAYELAKEQSGMEKMLNPASDNSTKAQLREAALESIINKNLIAQKVKELDIKISDEEIKQAIEDVKKQNKITQEALESALKGQGISYDQYKAQLKEQLERLRLISQEVRSKIQISDKEVQEYYAAHPEKFSREETFRARLISLGLPAKASQEEKQRIADRLSQIVSELKAGKKFDDLAKKYSEDPSAKEGGDLGIFKRGEMLPEFETVITKLSPGEVSEPFATQTAMHIVKLEERSAGDVQSLGKAKSEIEDMLYRKKSEERFNQWVAELRKNAVIEIKQ